MTRILPLFVLFLLLFAGQSTALRAQSEAPTANPVMVYTDTDGQEVEESSYDGSAPLHVTFKAQPENVGTRTALYEWRFTRGTETQPFLIRYEEDTEYDFRESGSFSVELRVSFVENADTVQYTMDTPFTLTISESKLEVPNAFTPNGDGVNDVFRVKEGYTSIISFRAQIFSRWGKKLYEWTDLDGGWDGRSGGHDMPDGGYYLHIEARGADGHKYNIKKVISLLRGYSENGSTTN